jgi:hypothetical protein
MARVFLIVGIFFAVAIFAVAGATQLPSYQQCESYYGQNTSHGEAAQRNQSPFSGTQFRVFMRCEGVAIDANSGTLTAVATVFLTIITGVLAWLAYKQNVTTQAELRAYISVEIATLPIIRQSQRHQLHFEFRPEIVNNGQTPAKEVSVISRADIGPFQPPANFYYRMPAPPAGQPRSVTTIGVGQKRFHNCILPRFLTPTELRDVYKGRHWFHIWGTVTYLDIFDVERQTNFSYVISVGNKRANPWWLATEKNNDAT